METSPKNSREVFNHPGNQRHPMANHPPYRKKGPQQHFRARPQNPFDEPTREVTVRQQDTVAPLRVANLNALLRVSGATPPQMASALEMQVDSFGQRLDGASPINKELATHIEHQLELPGSWLDHRHPDGDVPEKTKLICRGEARSEFVIEEEAREDAREKAEQAKVAEESVKTTATVLSFESPAASAPSAASVTSTHAETAQEAAMAASTAQTTQKTKRKTQAGAVAGNGADNAALGIRRANLDLLTQTAGFKAKLARLTHVSQGQISLLLSGERTFQEDYARDIEAHVGLKSGWMDKPQTAVPHSALDAIANETSVGAPLVREIPKRRGRTRTNPGAVATKSVAKKTASKAKAGAVHAQPVQRELLEEPVPAHAVASTPAPSKKSFTQRAPVPAAKKAIAGAAVRAQHPATAVTAAAESESSFLDGLPPIAKALLQTLRDRMVAGQLDDQRAVKMLTDLVQQP
ncbi:hypothetical protein F6X40_11155 [Paraburkholderia sp. UCT31]|uniref:hypothetical protein n=1 Tax=Paraburkholderia sp. UCT31 TaxID=2615209 RepID=UPI0016551DCC|nr:hypothetical protein [Paraburkholderia sp. UCT31]MBC8737361.1 hypothetical protein [Paraburkholderia sp. UCT31]